VTNVRYNVSLNNFYQENGIVQSGIIEYKLPNGAPEGLFLNFTFTILGRKATYVVVHTSAPVAINTQYIELGLVLVMMVIMVIFVRAPTRDEFYIDVPNLPATKKIEVKLKAAEVLSIFDKLNSNYHWKYMPLSKTEVKSAIALNMKYNNIPVELTYRNVDSILDSLLVKNYVVSADELYAPASWVDSSKHDINYLATFKKLRIYFVTHSYTFTDIDISEEADMVATLHGDRRYVVIYSDTSRFKNIPIYPGSRTYLVFINSDAMEEFKEKLYNTSSDAAEKLKMYISADYIRLVDADNIGKEIE
jgi:ribosome-associated toxin RatA of RatAB toxin-antitoxin module